MTLKHLPPTFCWTRIGAEAGEDLSTTVLRKEWERRLGGGRFLWGIGQSLGSSVQMAAHRAGSLMALFTPPAGRARALEPGSRGMLLWNAWVDALGQVRQLPPYTFITSRATLPSGRRREQHYALVCASPAPLGVGTRLRVTPAHLRSAGTGRPLGAAQAAAVVDCVARAAQPGARSYPVALAVELDAPYTVRLAQPSVLKLRELARIGKAAREGDFEAYVELVERLRGRSAGTQSRGFTRDLFDLPAVEPAAVYTDFVKRLRGRPPAEHARGLTRDLFDFSALEPVPVLGTAGDPQGSLLP
ncbi:hypothetical protein [Burkholderia glumae]|uniref:Uncharacterized protein n=1 Tax=Burkholderia glumae TaxID=337 RepID=A0AAP9XXU8_BURGL|nr:hypothetical protein [Burkholderia glumae]ACR30909.1 Hypothetical protein bglu_2g04540 [Burkholderia glumae BGR1]AJY63032.1 hypothetical protein KS03_5462 [Burkholderia glumae LMG 2196 = ATCC 33617]KHJ62078.1 hypothetical protein NCPPB3923_15395 [Burkholderia glumae]MCM2483778.1 hypothetical protein [Burkholderia glumae]MCM2494126.1 hypothetical protein [Burkholderia glumae]